MRKLHCVMDGILWGVGVVVVLGVSGGAIVMWFMRYTGITIMDVQNARLSLAHMLVGLAIAVCMVVVGVWMEVRRG